MKVSAILKGMIDGNGHQPVQIRIYHNLKRTFHPTGIKVNPDHFDNGKVLKLHPKYKDLNRTLEAMIIQQQAKALEGLRKKQEKVNFYTFVYKTISNLTRAKESVRQYESQLNKLREFSPAFTLDEVDSDFLDRYKAFLKTRGNGGNTVWSSFKFLRAFIRKAYKADLIAKYPFQNYEFPKYVEPHKNYLTENELKSIEKFLTAKGLSEKMKEAGYWFLISCDTGMRMSDIEAFLPKKNIVGDRLVFKTEKTKEMVGLPIDAKLRKLFEKVEYKKLSMHRKTFAELVKTIAAASGIDKNVSPHTGRHTAAMTLANSGISQELTAKVLGHRDLRSTRTYYHITNQRMDMEMKKRKR